MMRSIYSWALLLSLGCASATPAAEAPEPEVLDEPSAGASEGDDIDEGSNEGSPESAAETPSEVETEATPLFGDDLNAVLQAVVDDPELDRYLQTNKAGRAPLKISGEDLPSELEVIKAGYPLKVVEGPKSSKDPVLVITRAERAGNVATVAYRYEVEGIRGTTRVKKGRVGWELMSSRVMQ
jgi:hypothetical protein